MKAQTETTVLEKLACSLQSELQKEIEKCKSDEKFQSEELPEGVFQMRAHKRFSDILLKEIAESQNSMLFTAAKLTNK